MSSLPPSASAADLLSDGYPEGNTGYEPLTDENFSSGENSHAQASTNVQVNLRILNQDPPIDPIRAVQTPPEDRGRQHEHDNRAVRKPSKSREASGPYGHEQEVVV